MALAAPVLRDRPSITVEVTRGAARLLVDFGFAPLPEFLLPNGRRVDLMGLGPKGELRIIEVKSSLEDFRIDQKWSEYLPFCDRFYFAVAPEFPRAVLPGNVGLVIADRFGGSVLNECVETRLSPPRRKALTLAFARAAALRCAQASPDSPLGVGLSG